MSTSTPQPVEAIERALKVLDALAEIGPGGTSLLDLSNRLGLNKSTLYRTLVTLKASQYVTQDPLTSMYQLGPGAVTLADQFYDAGNLASLLNPVLVALCKEVGELVHLGVPFGAQTQFLDKAEPDRLIQVRSRNGEIIPSSRCAMGRAMIAASSTNQDQIATFALEPARGANPRRFSPMEPDYLWDQVQLARARGYARECEEAEPGIACVGVAILREGRPIAAISVTILAGEAPEVRLREIYQHMARVIPPLLPVGMSIPKPAEG